MSNVVTFVRTGRPIMTGLRNAVDLTEDFACSLCGAELAVMRDGSTLSSFYSNIFYSSYETMMAVLKQ